MTTSIGAERPTIVSARLQEDFEVQARRLGLRPSDPWVGGYVDYEWEHFRHVLEALPMTLAGARTLEFGCNVGASAILLARLGARVCASDIAPGWVALAQLNAQRYGCDDIGFAHVADSTRLPYADAQFDLITCNSVLEYVDGALLPAVQRELDRVLAPGGLILLTGTSNRLWPRETHSRRWLVNYLPRWVDRLLGIAPERGLWPWVARRGFGAHYANLDVAGADGIFLRSRLRMGVPRARLLPLMWTASLLGVGPGLLAPNLSCLLQKRR